MSADYYITSPSSDDPLCYCPDHEAALAPLTDLTLTEPPQGPFAMERCDDWMKRREDAYLAEPLTEISAEKYHAMLNILPPAHWMHEGRLKRFLVPEALFGSIYSQYVQAGTRYFEKTVRAGDRSTCITEDMIGQFLAAGQRPGHKASSRNAPSRSSRSKTRTHGPSANAGYVTMWS